MIMERSKALISYLAGVLGQIWIVCIVVFILRRSGVTVNYSSVVGWAAIAVGGLSSAIWGSIVSIKYRKHSFGKIVKDFFGVKQSPVAYLLVLLFLVIDFLPVIICGKFEISVWYLPITMFFQMLAFGGIEEIGWRYLFQPVLQEKLHYIPATLLTFVFWAIWHFSFFYIDGSLAQVSVIDFSIALLTNCFILSALFTKTKSLWICAMTHALINVFSTLATGGNAYLTCVVRVVIIAIAIVITQIESKRAIKSASST